MLEGAAPGSRLLLQSQLALEDTRTQEGSFSRHKHIRNTKQFPTFLYTNPELPSGRQSAESDLPSILYDDVIGIAQ